MRVEHCFPPVYNENSRVLILGTMPSPKSREGGFYYGNPQNRFWPVLAQIFSETLARTNQERRTLILRHGLALWDVLKACDIMGASDATIANPIANDIRPLLNAVPIRAVFCTGKTAFSLFQNFWGTDLGLPVVCLPSPSAANARFSLPMLVEAYRQILLYL